MFLSLQHISRDRGAKSRESAYLIFHKWGHLIEGRHLFEKTRYIFLRFPLYLSSWSLPLLATVGGTNLLLGPRLKDTSSSEARKGFWLVDGCWALWAWLNQTQSAANWMVLFASDLTLSLPRVINFKSPLQPHQNYDIHSMKNLRDLRFSS